MKKHVIIIGHIDHSKTTLIANEAAKHNCEVLVVENKDDIPKELVDSEYRFAEDVYKTPLDFSSFMKELPSQTYYDGGTKQQRNWDKNIGKRRKRK